MSERAFGGTALCKQHHIVASVCPYCEIDQLKKEIEELEKEISIMRDALEMIVNYQESRPWANRDKIAKEALKKVGGE